VTLLPPLPYVANVNNMAACHTADSTYMPRLKLMHGLRQPSACVSLS